MPGLSDVWLFSLFLFRSMGYVLAGTVVLGCLDIALHMWRNGSVTKQQYVWALGVCFILGLFIQWQDIQHQLSHDGQSQTIEELRNSLREKNALIEELKLEKDAFSTEADTEFNADISVIKTLQRRLDKKEREVSLLKKRLKERAAK